MVGGVDSESESGGAGLVRACSGVVSCCKKGEVISNRGAACFRNCCIEGGSSSGGISTARSSGGLSPLILLCDVLSSPTSTIFALPLLLILLTSILGASVSVKSVFVFPLSLPRPRDRSPIHELLIPRPFV